MFELNKTYRQQFSNGDAVEFTPTSRTATGNWRGFMVEDYVGRARTKRKIKIVFHPPLPQWKPVQS